MAIFSVRLLLAFPLLCSLLAAQNAGAGPPQKQTPAELTEAEHNFTTQCSYCHGPKGEGAIGPVLAVPVLRRAPDDQALFEVIRDGIPNTQMPASRLTNPQIRQVAAYVRFLGRVGQAKSTGDPKHGEELYLGKGGCARCHTVDGRGGAVGPELAGIGSRREDDFIRTSILDPEAYIPRDFLEVSVVTKDGRKVTGVRLNEDAFSIQVRDLSNQFHSFWKTDLAELTKEPKRSPMPSYRNSLGSGEVDDIVAYLRSLQGN
jgi:cytochrome c oxidase cbb3-type subunit 3